jgi:peptide-methionine (R)-S-oxide reductase
MEPTDRNDYLAVDTKPSATTRRAFIGTAAAGIAALIFWPYRRVVLASSPTLAAGAETGPVTIIPFSPDGKAGKPVTLPKVVKTDAEWQKQLGPNVYNITRRADTEVAWSGPLNDNWKEGLYRCICCDTALFSSRTKYDPREGWPSFWQPIAKQNVREFPDNTFGMERTQVACRLCDAHLGHLFDDGPQPTGLRYCMNSASLKFVAGKLA